MGKDYIKLRPDYRGAGFTGAADLYYRASGKVGLLSLTWTLLILALAVPPLGMIYGYAAAVNPFVFLNFIGAFIFGAVLGLVAYFGCSAGKVRSRAVALLLGLVFGVTGLYVSWLAFVHGMGGSGDGMAWLMGPVELWDEARFLAEEGRAMLFGRLRIGYTWTLVLWGAEALAVLYVSSTSPYWTVGYTPFCEDCGKSTDTEFEKWIVGPCDPPSLRSRLESMDMSALSELGEDTDKESTRVDLLICPSCRSYAALRVKATLEKLQKDGTTSIDTEPVVDNLVLTPQALAAAIELHRACCPEEKEDTAPADS